MVTNIFFGNRFKTFITFLSGSISNKTHISWLGVLIFLYYDHEYEQMQYIQISLRVKKKKDDLLDRIYGKYQKVFESLKPY